MITINTNVAGTTFRAKESPAFSTLRPEGEVKLIPKPFEGDNPDPLAIEVHWGKNFLGYIPKKKNDGGLNVQDFCHKAINKGVPLISKVLEYSYTDGSKDDNGKLVFNDDHRGQLQYIKLEISADMDVETPLVEGKDYRMIDGKAYPRVTKVTGQLTDWDSIPDSVLKPAMDEGTRVHALMEEMVKDGKFEDIEGYKVKKCIGQMVNFFASNGFDDLGFEIQDGQIAAKDKITGMDAEVKVKYDGAHRYVGTADVVTRNAIIDWKTGSSTGKRVDDYMMQLAAYAQASGKQFLIIADLKEGTIYTTNPLQTKNYYEKFLLLRRIFKTRYGI